MSTSRPHALCKLIARITTFALVIAISGCASHRAAMLYRDGTRELDAGRHEQARARLEEAARLAPDASQIQNHLGLALAAGGDHAAALAAFERAVELDCDNASASRNLEAARQRAAAQLGARP